MTLDITQAAEARLERALAMKEKPMTTTYTTIPREVTMEAGVTPPWSVSAYYDTGLIHSWGFENFDTAKVRFKELTQRRAPKRLAKLNSQKLKFKTEWAACLPPLLLMIAGCSGGYSSPGSSCTVTQIDDGSAIIECADGTSAALEDGTPGAPCSVASNGDGTRTITCGDGTSIVILDSSITTLEGNYQIRNSLDAALITSVTTITGNLTINAVGFTNIDLPNLTTIGGELHIYGELTNLGGLSNLISVGSLHIQDNPNLTSLDGLESLETLTSQSSTTGKSLSITDNATLTNLAGLEDIELLSAGGLEVTWNTTLPQCEATTIRDQLLATGWDGSVDISNNNELGTCL